VIRCSAFLCVAVLSTQTGIAPDVARVNDMKSWRVIDAHASVEGLVVRLKPHGDPAVGHIGLALVQQLKLSEGTLEIDLRETWDLRNHDPARSGSRGLVFTPASK
jgi:hypothetical protein